jgi:hypothetical protein
MGIMAAANQLSTCAREGSAHDPTFDVSRQLYLLTNQTRVLDLRGRAVQAANHLGDSDAEAAELVVNVPM